LLTIDVVVPGAGAWEYSEKAVQLIQSFLEAFPALATALRQMPGGPGGKLLNLADIFPDADPVASLESAWLRFYVSAV
jgi:hypothetical protein